MEIPGSSYLYALATVSITFVGFSALLMIFRQTMGSAITRYDSFFTLSFIQTGFIVTAGSMLPQLLALFEWSHRTVWRASSATMAIAILLFVGTFPVRRRAATEGRAPLYVNILLAVQSLVALSLLSNAIGKPLEPNGAAYASAMAAFLVTAGIAYLMALGVMLQGPVRRP
ncbi:MAG TPA: hypothetical protein VNH12_05340 [Burkholderiales bacterium]|jgi:hypothetical protein|nr:hypothetical protein [Burkholderiales bacterium]